MKTKFPLILLLFFIIFAFFRITINNITTPIKKQDYIKFEKVIGELKYNINEKEMKKLSKMFNEINAYMSTSATKSVENDSENMNNLLKKMNTQLSFYTKKYLVNTSEPSEDKKDTQKDKTLEDSYLDSQDTTNVIDFDDKKKQVQKKQMENLSSILNSEDMSTLRAIVDVMNEKQSFLDPTTHQQILSILLKYNNIDSYLILGQLIGRFEILAYYEIENGNIIQKKLNAIDLKNVSKEDNLKYINLINRQTLLLDVVYSKYFKGFFIFSDGEKNLLSYASDFQNNKRGYLGIDATDFSAGVSNDFEKTRFYHSIINELSRVILLSNSQIDYTKYTGVSDIDDFDIIKELSKKDSYLLQFYNRFWSDIMYQDSKTSTSDDELRTYFYLRHKNEFVNEYVSQDPFKDIIESLTRFILEQKPTELEIKHNKIRFFYEFSEINDIKDRVELNIKHLEK